MHVLAPPKMLGIKTGFLQPSLSHYMAREGIPEVLVCKISMPLTCFESALIPGWAVVEREARAGTADVISMPG